MIDVYEGNGLIDWAKVHGAGITRAYVKRSEGTVHADSRTRLNVEHARAAGVTPGLYHYAGSSVNRVLYPPHREASYFLELAAGLWQPGDLPPALDFEDAYGHAWDFCNDWKTQWFAAVDDAVGCRAVFYSYYYFWKQMRLYADRPVWGAAYGKTFEPPASWTFHQYSATGRVDGVPGAVDLDRVLVAAADVPAIPAAV